MKSQEEIDKMTPLERARYRASLPEPENCVTCGNCVEVGGFYYCETNGKMLIPRYMNIGRCPEVPSKYKKKEKIV